jgi:hypothetical protein
VSGRTSVGNVAWLGRPQALAAVGRVVAAGVDSVLLPPEHIHSEREIRRELSITAWERGISVRMRRTGRALQIRRHHFVVRTADRFITSLTTIDQVIAMAALHGRIGLMTGADDPPAETLTPIVQAALSEQHRSATVWAAASAIEVQIGQSMVGSPSGPRNPVPPQAAHHDADAQRVTKAMNEVPPF